MKSGGLRSITSLDPSSSLLFVIPSFSNVEAWRGEARLARSWFLCIPECALRQQHALFLHYGVINRGWPRVG